MATYQRKDHFHQRAKREGFRSRAAYKLAEIQQAQRLLRAGQRVVDLGCWPGGWLQVAEGIVGPRGRVVGVDLARVDPGLAEHVEVLALDFTSENAAAIILDALGGPADLLLSDAAPKLTGIRDRDRANEEALLQAIEALIPALLRPGGDLLLKLLDGPEATALSQSIGRCFARSKTLKPAASRKGTTERYLVARSLRETD